MLGEEAGLQVVECEHLIELVIVQPIEFAAGQEFLDRDDGLADLRGQLGRRCRIPNGPEYVDNRKRTRPHLLDHRLRTPLQDRPLFVWPAHIGCADLTT
jgi:hypothetical protein